MVKSEASGLKILGIDPGTTRMGYALIEGSAMNPRLVASGVIGDPRLPADARLLHLADELTKLFESWKPDVVAIEKLFFAKNKKTALSVAEARGVILLTAKKHDRRVYEYAPSEVKIAVTGNGAANKREVSRIIEMLLGKLTPRYDDETDAIAIAITGLVTNRNLKL